MKRLFFSLLTCVLILGHSVSSQAFNYKFEYDPVDIFILSEQDVVNHSFNINFEIPDLFLIRSATLSVYLMDIDPEFDSPYTFDKTV
jgi:hypothetical protein